MTLGLTLDDMEQLLVDHRYWSGDDMTDENCSCDEWPVYKRNGEPTENWVEHMLKMARRVVEDRRDLSTPEQPE